MAMVAAYCDTVWTVLYEYCPVTGSHDEREEHGPHFHRIWYGVGGIAF